MNTKTTVKKSMMKPDTSDVLTPWICKISRLSTLFMGREMTRLGFGPGQFYLLAELYDQEGLPQDELSRRVGVDKSNTSRALAKLESYGFVERRVSSNNHKEKLVHLTPNARQLEAEFRKIQGGWNEILLAGLSNEEQQAVLSGLTRMLNNAQAHIHCGPREEDFGPEWIKEDN